VISVLINHGMANLPEAQRRYAVKERSHFDIWLEELFLDWAERWKKIWK